jgi:hypothetical protein
VKRTEKISSIIMAGSVSSEFRTRHIDKRHHLIREHLEDGTIKLYLLNQLTMIQLSSQGIKKLMKGTIQGFREN